jgi:hypothetical protein
MHRRVVFDAIGILVGTIVGYRLLVDFIGTEGLATATAQNGAKRFELLNSSVATTLPSPRAITCGW